VSSGFTLFKDANVLFVKRQFAEAEAKLREAIRREPANTVTRALFARALAAQNKFDEAKAEIENIQKLAPLPIYTITWINYTMGEVALAAGQRDAVEYFRRTVAASKDVIPARQKLIETERAATKLPAVDESVRSFISQLDRSIRGATNQALDPIVVRANLNKFVRGIVANKPESWSTQILRAEQITADKVAVDVSITAVSGDKQQQQGTALFILRRTSSGWILSDIELFNVQ
jgi:tetratricopeptide (TPR) repeat protein